jgi:hypothetical protein
LTVPRQVYQLAERALELMVQAGEHEEAFLK